MRSWNDYFWPGTTVLANKLGTQDPAALSAKESARTSRRAREIAAGVVKIPRTFDAEHVKALHGYLFQDVYEWAGNYREVNMSKDGIAFAEVGQIDSYLSDVARLTKDVPWADLEPHELTDLTARVYANYNHAHPFREGNGRVGKLLIGQLTETTGYDFDFNAVDPRIWNQQSAFSGPDLGERTPHHEELTPVFKQIMIDRPAPQRAAPSAIEAALRAARFSGRDHPTAARQAGIRTTAGQGPQSTAHRPTAHYRRDPGRDNASGRD
ncbi:Fic family protein [Nocardia sp. 348MFTsu5.1]|uniref:Fic/DOC family protein n=1 Tax=Nocardia sp. 348MFTsu5.1 TaxID=1172185 RepID=UPI00037FE9E9|nr:Fic family protein [Nocardia sp. 348MFTsu5.1]